MDAAQLKALLPTKIHSVGTLRSFGYYFPPEGATEADRTTDGYRAVDFAAAPPSTSSSSSSSRSRGGRSAKRFAVAVDCEMVGVVSGREAGRWEKERSEVVRVAAVDVATGEVLMDAWVRPEGWVRNWRSFVTGVTPAAFAEAGRQGKVVSGGWRAARERLWRFVGAETVLVGHALQNDLKALRMVPGRVVDTSILSSQAAAAAEPGYSCCPDPDEALLLPPGRPGGRQLWGLGRLGRELMLDEAQRESGAHCPLEDARAVRALILSMLGEPERLAAWARGRLAEYLEEKAAAEAEKAKGKYDQDFPPLGSA